MGNQHSASGAGYRHRKNVHWKSAEVPLPPGRPVAMLGEGPEGREGRLRWAAPRHDGGAPLQGYMVECNRIGSPIWVRTNPPLVLGAELILAGLEAGHRYRFRVTAQNAIGSSCPSEISDVLDVDAEPNATGPLAPYFQEGLADSESMENDKTEFTVYFDGRPQPTVAWFKDGFEIFSSRRTAILTDGGRSTLIIHQTSLNDEGEIKCTITNRAGHAVSRARLRLHAAPRVRLPRRYEDGLLFEAGEQLHLKVAVAGKPTPDVIWRHDGQDVTPDERVQIIDGDKFTSLKIAQATREDRGEYQVYASNDIGEDAASFLVTVTAKPDRPRNVTALYEGDRKATVSWDPPEDDGGCRIGNYVVEYYRTGWNVWLKATTERKTTATLADLIEGSEYRFRVKAESPYGMSEPSAETRSVFVPGKSSNLDVLTLPAEEEPPSLAPPRRKRFQSPRPDSANESDKEDRPIRKQRSLDADNEKNKMGSSEFMLILYPDNAKATEEKRKSVQQDLEDAMTPPTLSLSAPQLGANLCLFPPLRFSVSSTELLHEQAMNRMYQVMALKEAESVKMRKEANKTELAPPMRRQPSPQPPPRVEEIKMEVPEARSEESLDKDRSEENDAFEDDYTTSTVSTGDSEYTDSDSLPEGRSRKDNFNESNTYHPQDMTPRGIPERNESSPSPDVKVKLQIPLPDPNFIPKPILKKRDATEGVVENKKSEKPAKSRPLLSKVPLLKRITKSSTGDKKGQNKKAPKVENIPRPEKDATPKAGSVNFAKPNEKEKEDLGNSHVDEGHIVAERYANIVREYGNTRRQQPMVYTNTEDLKKAAAQQLAEEPPTPPPPPPPKENLARPVKKTAPTVTAKRQLKIVEPSKENSTQKKASVRPLEIANNHTAKPPVVKKPPPVVEKERRTSETIQTVSVPKNFSELNAEAETTVRGAFNYIINVFMVVVAAWLYFFKSELLAIPFIALAVYRELHAEIKNRIPRRWLAGRK